MEDDQAYPRFGPRTLRKRENARILSLRLPGSSPPMLLDNNSLITSSNDLEVTVEFRLDYAPEDLLDLKEENLVIQKEIHSSGSGTLNLVYDTITTMMMVRKVIYVPSDRTVRKRIMAELRVMHDCKSPYLILFYGSFPTQGGDIVICTEYMDVGSLDHTIAAFGPIRVDILGKIAEAVFGALSYLYSKHRIMHRDVRPAKILVNLLGAIKLCGFGNSRQLIGSVADTYTGSHCYMAPERIVGESYTVKADVWSAGLTLMELAVGVFPIFNESPGDVGGILDLYKQIVNEPSPKLPQSDAFPTVLENMIDNCLAKDPTERKSPQELYDNDPFILASKRTPVDLKAWALSVKR